MPDTDPSRRHHSRRVILVGASNLSRGISTVVGTARIILKDPPLEVFAAFGHGRSYGIRSSILGRALPGITQSGIWEALKYHDRARANGTSSDEGGTFGLITDIGNDVMYGVEPRRIADWVRFCVEQMLEQDARVVITDPPMEGIESLDRIRYYATKTLLYPFRRMSLAEAQARLRETYERVVELAVELGVPRAPMRTEWYGIDPIHIRLLDRAAAWREILSVWIGDDAERQSSLKAGATARSNLRRFIALRTAVPQRRWLLFLEQNRHQPAVCLPDGIVAHLY